MGADDDDIGTMVAARCWLKLVVLTGLLYLFKKGLFANICDLLSSTLGTITGLGGRG